MFDPNLNECIAIVERKDGYSFFVDGVYLHSRDFFQTARDDALRSIKRQERKVFLIYETGKVIRFTDDLCNERYVFHPGKLEIPDKFFKKGGG